MSHRQSSEDEKKEQGVFCASLHKPIPHSCVSVLCFMKHTMKKRKETLHMSSVLLKVCH